MKTLRTLESYQSWRQTAEDRGWTVGVVPTLGGLHAGHRALIKRSVKENDATVVTLFKNPTQFNDPQDLVQYPAHEEADLAAAKEARASAVLLPDSSLIYGDDYRFRVEEYRDSRILEGAHRPGHFTGVLTVVLKLLLLTRPHRAYFGEKDYQQLHLVRELAKVFFLNLEIVGCPTVRDADGLALSSRNALLSEEERVMAAEFPRILRGASGLLAARQGLEQAGFGVDYVEDWAGRRLGAVRIGKVRLLDNFPLKEVGGASLSGRMEAAAR